VLLIFITNTYLGSSDRWCHGHCICLECGTSWGRAPVGSNQGL